MLVEVPDDLAGEIPAMVAAHKETMKREAKHQAKIDMLNTDHDLSWFEFGDQHDHKNMFARESDYKPHSIPMIRYLLGHTDYDGVKDPPVIMAGSKYSLHRRYCKSSGYDNPYGWRERVADRYLRFIKFTSYGRNWNNRNTHRYKEHRRVEKLLRDRLGGGSFRNPADMGKWDCYIKGKLYFVNSDCRDTVASMKVIFKQLHKLDNVERVMQQLGSV